MSDEKTFGYKYNNVGELVVDKNEAEIVKLMFDLTQNYKLNSSEVVDFLNKTKTVVEIISNRIDDFIVVISRYDKNKSKILEKHNFDDILNDNELIQEKIIIPLLEWKESKLDLDMKDDIDDLIDLLKNKDELINKYNNLKKIRVIKKHDIDLNY